jgi:hypothetical protein
MYVLLSLSIGAEGLTLCSKDEGKFDPRSIPLKSWNDYVSPSFHVNSVVS